MDLDSLFPLFDIISYFFEILNVGTRFFYHNIYNIKIKVRFDKSIFILKSETAFLFIGKVILF